MILRLRWRDGSGFQRAFKFEPTCSAGIGLPVRAVAPARCIGTAATFVMRGPPVRETFGGAALSGVRSVD